MAGETTATGAVALQFGDGKGSASPTVLLGCTPIQLDGYGSPV